MAERLSSLILLGLVLWSALGVAGLLLARSRRQTLRFRRGVGTLLAVWVGYMAVLVGVSLHQPARRYLPGVERCFDGLCFAVTGTEELPGFWVRGQERERLLRVAVRMTNRTGGTAKSEDALAAYLLDGQGRRWEQVPGLGGVRLSTPVVPGRATTSEPVFRVPRDSTGFNLVLRHTRWTAARWRIGDPESWLHRPAEMVLPPVIENRR